MPTSVDERQSNINRGGKMFRGIFASHAFAALASVIIVMAISNQRAAAQVVYSYTGQSFTLFSCGPTQDGTAECTTVNSAETSYTTADHVTATLSFDSPLGPNFAYSDVSGLPGFSLSLNDGLHTVSTPLLSGQSLIASVGTDQNGNINHWELVINTGGIDNGGISTQDFTVGSSNIESDQGTLSCCGPTPPGDLAQNVGMPGTWSGGSAPPSPTTNVDNLIATVSNPLLGLTSGQISSLTDKLNNVLASLQAGQTKQASNQLSSFINSIQSSVKTQKISTQTGNTLITAANTIMTNL